MITIKEGDLFKAPRGVICHQVNCMGVMGAGVAKTFKERFPEAYQQYKKNCDSLEGVNDFLLGSVQIDYNPRQMIPTCCMYSQLTYGRNGCYTRYGAFRDCCKKVAEWVGREFSKQYPINMPYKIGCGLAGGDWDIIYKILDEEFKDYNLILWKLN